MDSGNNQVQPITQAVLALKKKKLADQGISSAPIEQALNMQGGVSQSGIMNQAISALSNNKTSNPSVSIGGQLDGHEYDGLCEKYVEQKTLGKTGLYPSAIDAWNAHTQQGDARPGLSGAKDGDVLVFGADDTNGKFGHTGIVTNGGKDMQSATYDGIKTVPISQWIKSTGQQLLGNYSPTSTPAKAPAPTG